MSGVVLHVGFPKTGTTTLQKSVYPHLPGVLYVGKHIPSYGFSSRALGDAVHAVITADSALSDPVPALATAISEFRANCASDTLVISTESFAHPTARDFGLVASRLAAAVPDARILLTIRAQEALALSWYQSHGRFAQYLFTHKRESERIRASLSQRAWWDLVQRASSSGFLAMLDFDAVVACYEKLFSGRVTVLPMEWLQRCDARYASTLASVLQADAVRCTQLLQGAHENRGLSRREVLAGRMLSFVGVRADFLEHRSRSALRRFLSRGAAAERVLHPEIARDIQRVTAKGNARLAARTSIDLAALGYAVA